MDRKDLINIFDGIKYPEIDENKKLIIIDKIILYNQYIELSRLSLIKVIENFIKLDNLGLIDKIDDNLFILLKKILGKKDNNKIKEVESLYILDYINYLVLPYNVNNCENEYELKKFLGEFEIMVSYIEADDSFLDMEKLKTYNKDLYDIIIFRISWYMSNIHNNDNFKRLNYRDQILIDTTLNHLMTIYYFSLDKYQNDINILMNAYDAVINNFDNLKTYCRENNLYNDILAGGLINDSKILDEFEYCKDILDGLNEKNKKKVK